MKLQDKMATDAGLLRFIFPQRATPHELAEYYGVKTPSIIRALEVMHKHDVSTSFAKWEFEDSAAQFRKFHETSQRLDEPSGDTSKIGRAVLEFIKKNGEADALTIQGALSDFNAASIRDRLKEMANKRLLVREQIPGARRRFYRYRLPEVAPLSEQSKKFIEAAERLRDPDLTDDEVENRFNGVLKNIGKTPRVSRNVAKINDAAEVGGLRDIIKVALTMGKDADLDEVVDLVSSVALKEAAKRGGQKGGINRAAALSPDRRSDIAKEAAKTRWAAQDSRRGEKDAEILLARAEEWVDRFPNGMTVYSIQQEMKWDTRRTYRAISSLVKHGKVKKAVYPSAAERGESPTRILFRGMKAIARPAPEVTEREITNAFASKRSDWREINYKRAIKRMDAFLALIPELVKKYPSGMTRGQVGEALGKHGHAAVPALIELLVSEGYALWEESGAMNRKVLLLDGMFRQPPALSALSAKVLEAMMNAPGASFERDFSVSYNYLGGATGSGHSTIATSLASLMAKGYLVRTSDPSQHSAATYRLIEQLPTRVTLKTIEKGSGAEAPEPSLSPQAEISEAGN